MSEPERNEARDAGVLVFGRFVGMLAEAAVPFVLVRVLGKADVGAWAGLWLIYNTLATVLTAGFPAAVLYYMPGREPPQRAAIVRRLYGAIMVLGLLIGVLMLLIGIYGDQLLASFGQWLSGDDSEPTDLHALRYMAVFPLFDVLARVFPNYLIAIGRAPRSATFSVLRAIGLSAGKLIPAALGFGVPGIVVGLTIFAAAQATSIGWVVRRQHRGIARVEADVGIGEMLRFAYPLGLTEIITILNAAIDRYAILLLFAAELMAEYDAGAWQIPITAVAYSVGHVYMPRFVEMLEQGKGQAVVELWRESVNKVSLIVIPVCVVFVVGAEEFITVAFTDEYLAAVPVFRAYSIYTMGRVASFGALILAAGRSELIFKAAAFSLVSNLVLTIPLVLTIGFVGPAIGTALAFVPTVAIYCVYIARALDVDWRRTFPLGRWLAVVGVSALAAAPAVALKLLVPMHPIVALLAYAVTTVACFVLLARVTGLMSGEDLAFASRWLRLDFLFDSRRRPVDRDSDLV